MANHSLLSALFLITVGWVLSKVLPKDLYEKIVAAWKNRKGAS